MQRTILAVLTLVLAISGAVAQTTWKLDNAHSAVKFSVTHMVIAEVPGNFREFDVTFTQKGTADFAGSSLSATIKTASINTDNEGRDKHLRSDDFFNADKFPAITFTSTSFEKTGTDTYVIKGDLTIRDVTKPVVLNARYTGTVKDPRGNTKIGFKATTAINRFDFGVKWNKAVEAGGLVVGETVDITLLMEFAQAK
ncbi:MAG: polyisoprenoid-binding protein [Ignavibacteriae bacterium]|nr:polyisoprenoid-binding protein [Ignavibacteriota bacterium]